MKGVETVNGQWVAPRLHLVYTLRHDSIIGQRFMSIGNTCTSSGVSVVLSPNSVPLVVIADELDGLSELLEAC